MNKILVRTGAWCGDKKMIYKVPDNWDVSLIVGKKIDKINKEEIVGQIKKSGLKEKSLGRQSAVIVVDDIMRPTPVAEILAEVVRELIEGGVPKNKIKIVIASGSHPKAKISDIELKVGKEFAEIASAHDDMDNLEYLGKSKRGTAIYVNKSVMEADLKISIGGIYPHPFAGFSGGAKTFVPGVCGFETISKLHAKMRAGKAGGKLNNQFRAELEEIATMIGVDFVVNVVITPEREIAGLFAGEMQAAHKKGVDFVRKYCEVKTMSEAEVVISNSYPFDGSYYYFSRGFWPLATGKRGSIKIAIVDGSMTKKLYSFKHLEQNLWDRVRKIGEDLLGVMMFIYNPIFLERKLRELVFSKRPDFYLFYTGKADYKELQEMFGEGKVFSDWEELLKKIVIKMGDKRVKVAYYPYASLQYQK